MFENSTKNPYLSLLNRKNYYGEKVMGYWNNHKHMEQPQIRVHYISHS